MKAHIVLHSLDDLSFDLLPAAEPAAQAGGNASRCSPSEAGTPPAPARGTTKAVLDRREIAVLARPLTPWPARAAG